MNKQSNNKFPKIFHAIFTTLQLILSVVLIVLLAILLRHSFFLWIGLSFSFIILINVILNIVFVFAFSRRYCGTVILVIANSLQFFLALICIIFVVASLVNKGLLYSFAGTTAGFEEFCKSSDLCNELDGLDKVVKSAKPKYIFVPVIAMVLLVLIAILLISSFYFKGRNFFALFVVYIGNCTNLLFGIFLVIIGIILLVYGHKQTFSRWSDYRSVFGLVVALGSIMAVAGVFGFIAVCAGRTRPGCYVLVIAVSAVVALAFAAATVFAALRGSAVVEALLQLAEVDDALLSPFPVVRLFEQADDRTGFLRGIFSAALEVVFAAGIVFLFLSFLLMTGGCIKGCTCCQAVLDDVKKAAQKKTKKHHTKRKKLKLFSTDGVNADADNETSINTDLLLPRDGEGDEESGDPTSASIAASYYSFSEENASEGAGTLNPYSATYAFPHATRSSPPIASSSSSSKDKDKQKKMKHQVKTMDDAFY